MVLYPQFSAEISEFSVVKLLPIVRDDDARDSKPANKILPHEVLYLRLCYHCKRFYFHPLRKIINSNDQKLYLFLTTR